MPGEYKVDIVRLAAERHAHDWLVAHGYCDCAGQEQVVALRLLPVLAMFEPEIRRDAATDRGEIAWRLNIYYKRAARELARGLHRFGASATTPEEQQGDRGIAPHC